ncbi:MAG: dihydroorotate dehydrogenase electron transfer subunit [Chlorobiales bacterium]|nr:dihydroorotate dehydrogenase electron transfer subunit [Chlorobiales bacterium]
MRADSAITDNTVTITSSRNLGPDVSLITFRCPQIAKNARPGNFVNIKISPQNQPLLRRPFSIHNVESDTVEIMAKSVGCGTTLLCGSPVGAELQVLGPLGNAFTIDSPRFETALLVSGGIGTAPMRFLEKKLHTAGKKVYNIIGGRSGEDVLTEGLTNCFIATEDGSDGFRGTAIDLLEERFAFFSESGPVKAFSCGPNPMLKAFAAFCQKNNLPCEASLESIMGCGIGICYGCTVELKNISGSGTSTILLCQDGPVIDVSRLLF